MAAFSMLAITLHILSHSVTLSTQGYFIDEQTNCNNVYGATNGPNNSTKYVTFLGIMHNTNDCIKACLDAANSTHQCESYTYHTKLFGGDYADHCFARFGYPLWTPISQTYVNCGRIIWNCQDNKDCSLNGKCILNTGNCTCHNGWKGYKCGYLDLNNINISTAGYIIMNDSDHDNKPTSSWGGSVIVSKKGNWTNQTKYHMFLTEFDNHCGLGSWSINSVVTHAISTNGYNSPYKRVEIIHANFAAEPDIIRGNNGEMVLYYNTYNYSEFPECHCNDGSTPPGCKTPNPTQYITVMQWTNQDHGPYNQYFNDPITIFSNRPNDTDLGGVINQDAQFIGMLRKQNASTGSEIYLVIADNWKDAHTYKQYSKILFPELTPLLTEDPFLWIDCNGNYH
eukprot:489699_1